MSRPLRHHPSPGEASRRARNVGYLVAVVVNSILLLMVNARPGRRVLPFLTEDFVGILWLVKLSLVASAGVNGGLPLVRLPLVQVGLSGWRVRGRAGDRNPHLADLPVRLLGIRPQLGGADRAGIGGCHLRVGRGHCR